MTTGDAATLEPGPGALTAHRPLGPPSAERSGRRRRPTGAPPPLPRHLGLTGKLWLAGAGGLVGWIVLCALSAPVRAFTDRADSAVLRQIARLRSGWLTDVMTAVDRIGSGWTLTLVALGLLVGQVVFRRWRHLITFLVSLALLEVVGEVLYDGFSRPRPYGVTAIGRWAGYSLPSPPVAVLAAVLIGVAYSHVVPGKSRTLAKLVIACVLALFAFARLYLGVDHPLDVLVAVTLGVAIPLTAFRTFTPNEAFPVAYRRGKTAHLDVGGKRGEAIRCALMDQLGLHVLDVRPFGLEGSGGSTPLRVTVAGSPDTALFAKLYAMSHVRADRWYKMGRRILYGALEDEAPFQSVRRLAQHEDYALRLLRDLGLPTAEPYGIVEITPEREYLVVTGFFEGAEEIGDADVDDQVIDEALLVVRQLWDAGLAHRDIKPANVLVQDGHVRVIDVAFVAVRSTPWRQAVDLANMMLVLGVRTDSERVYRRALQLFSPEEIAEAFAAARGVASPSQLRSVLKQDGRDLVAQFRALAPARRPIAIQRWSVRRVALAGAVVAVLAFAVTTSIDMIRPVHDVPVADKALCGTGSLMVLVAQAVPTAVAVPCIAALPAGWESEGTQVKHGRVSGSIRRRRGVTPSR
ncbi:MAG: phosphatase PAP2 family protein [Acidimicrobiia bacterium]|nr:phosphatase PAP2 family protein [Acidimicrobiia bacterium]